MGESDIPEKISYPIAIVGAGKLGSAIEKEAREQRRNLVDVIDPNQEGRSDWKNNNLSNANLAILVTSPDVGYETTKNVLERGKDAVVGTTKFYENEDGSLNQEMLDDLENIAKQNNARFLYAPNFTQGITGLNNLLWQISLGYAENGWRPVILEAHHTGKTKDVSGTAKRLLAPPILSAYGMNQNETWSDINQAIWPAEFGEEYDNERYARDLLKAPVESSVEGEPADEVREQVDNAEKDGKLPIIAVRYGDIPGSHAVIFRNYDKNIGKLLSDRSEEHHVRDRSLFAKSALGTADWLKDQPPGLYSIKQRYDIE